MKNIIIVSGGAGFVGSNLIKKLVQITNKKIISIDDYSSGKKENHIKSHQVKYVKGSTKNVNKILRNNIKKIHSFFHFGEFSRIYQSFPNYKKCLDSNITGSKEVFLFCLKNKIKLIYSATSASLGNKGKDKNLSPYAFTKAKNLEFLENLKKWFNLKYEIIYFYNVYGPNHIKTGKNATIIGIFEDQTQKRLPLTVVRPGSQKRRFTHIDDTIKVCIKAWKLNKNCHYAISNKNSYSIISIAKMFKGKIKYIPFRKGERFVSRLTKMNLSNNIKVIFGKKKIKDYINEFISTHPK